MATEADIPAPICETRGEQGGNLVDLVTNISINKPPKEEKIQVDTYDELPTVEGENFLRPPSTGEVHCEVNNNLLDVSKVTEKPGQTVKDETEISTLGKLKLDDQPLEIAANEETSSEGVQQNGEESNGLDKDEDRGLVAAEYSTYSPMMASEMKAGDTLDRPDLDDVRVETEQSKDITSDHHGANDSFSEKIAVSEETLQVTNLPSEETKESKIMSILESEELNVQGETTDEKAGAGKTTEEDISCNITSDVSKGECGQNEMTSQNEGLGNERKFKDDFDSAAEKGSQETSTETVTNETSKSDELQSKNDLNSSLRNEEDIVIQKDDRPETTPENSGLILENTLSESHGDVECQSKTLEDTATDNSDLNLTEKSEESSFIQVDGSQIERDEQLEEDAEKVPSTEISTGGTDNNVSAAIEKVKDEDEGHNKAKLFENEQNTSASLKEDVQIENPAESLHVAPENIEASNLGQEKSTKSSTEDQSTNGNLHENKGSDAKEKTIDAVDTQEEILESSSTTASSFPEEGSINAVLPEVLRNCSDEKIIDEANTQKEVLEKFSTVSNEDVEGNSTIKLDGSETKDEEHLGKESEETCSPLPLGRYASDNEPIFLNEERIVDEEPRNAELCDNEKSTESVLLKEDSQIEKPEDPLHVISEDIKSSDLGQEIETRSCIEEQRVTTHPQGIPDEKTEEETVDAAETKEETVNAEEVPPHGKTTEEDIPCNITSDVSKGECGQNKMNSEQEGLGNERYFEDVLDSAAEKESQENSTSTETIRNDTSNSDELQSKHGLKSSIRKEDVIKKDDRPVTTPEDSGIILENTLNESHGDVGCQSKTLEDTATDDSDPNLTEKFEESSFIQVDGSQVEHDEQLEEEKEKLPSTEGTNDNVLMASGKIEDEDEGLNEAKLFENKNAPLKEDVQIENPADSLHVAPENIEASTLGQENNTKSSLEDQSTNGNLHENTEGDTGEKPIDAVDKQKEILESFSKIASSSPEEGSINAEVSSDCTDETIIHEADTKNEITENVSTTSNEDVGGNSAIKLDGSETKDEEHLGKESEETSLALPLPLGREARDNESIFLDEARIEDVEPRKAEFCENEKCSECVLLKVESQIEKPEDSLHVISEDIKSSDLGQEIETRSCIEKQSVTTHPQGIPDDKTEEETVDGAETKEETVNAEDVPTIVPNEKTVENSSIQVDGPKMENEEHLGKDNEPPSLIEDFTRDIVTDEVKIEAEKPSRAELLENKNTESALLKEEVQTVKRVESVHADLEDVKASDLGQHAETTGFLEEQSLIENPQGIPGDKTEEKTIDAANTSEETQELQNVSNEDNEKDSLIQVDASEMEQNTDLEKEMERPPLTEASVEDANDDKSTILVEPKIGDKCPKKVELFDSEKNIDSTLLQKEELQDASEDHKASTSSEDIETTCSLKEESLVTSNDTIDATNTKEVTLEVQNVATKIPHEHTEESSVIQVDCLKTEHEEHLERDSENSSLTEAPTEETNARESKNIHEPENKSIDSIKSELEKGENTESTSVKEEAQVEKPIDSSQAASEDIKAYDSSQDTNSCREEKIPTANPEEISNDKTEKESIDAADLNEESLEDIAKNIPDDVQDNSPIEEDGSQKTSLEEAITGNSNDESTVTHEAKLVGENEKNTECTSVKEEEYTESLQVPTQDKTSDAISAEEETPADKDISKTTPYEDLEENLLVQVDRSRAELNEDLKNDSENTSLTEDLIGAQVEKHIESLQAATEDIKASASCQETCSIEEQIITADPKEISCDSSEEKTIDAAYTKENLKNVATNVPHENEDNSQIEVDGSQKPSLEEALTGNANCDESTIIQDAEFAEENIVKADLLGNEKNIECALVKEEVPVKSLQEEAQVEKPTNSLQTAPEHIKASDSSQDSNSSIKEKFPTANPKEISSDKTEKESTDAAVTNEESHEDIATNIPDGGNADNSPIDEEGSQKPSLEEATTGNSKDEESTVAHEAKLVGENEKNTECTLVKEEVPTKSLHVAALDIKAFALGQDRETNSLEEQSLSKNLEAIMGDTKEDKNSDATGAEEETPENKDTAKTTPYEDIKENLLVQVDCSRAEQNEDFENDSENTSLAEAPTGDTTESTLVKEEAQVEKPIDSLQGATKDIKASASCQETSPIEEQILTADPQKISCDRTEGKTIDAAYTKKESLQDVATNVPTGNDEDNSPVEVDGSQKTSLEETTTVNKTDEESTVTHEAKLVGENEKNAECTSVKEEVESLQVPTQDTEASALGQDRESSPLEEQSLTTNPEGIMDDTKEDKTSDATGAEEEIPEDQKDIAKTAPYEDEEENLLAQVHCSQAEKNENLENDSENSSLTEAPIGETMEGILVKEEAQVEKSIDSLQVASKDIKASASCQETSSTEKKILTSDPQEISCDRTEEKAIDVADTMKENLENVATNVPNGNDEDNSPLEVDRSQKPSLEEALTGNTNDDELTIIHDVKSADENIEEADLFRNEKIIECALVKEEASVKSLQVENEDMEATASSQDRETSHLEEQCLTTNPQGHIGDPKEDKTIYVIDLKEETFEDKSCATTSNEETKENSLIQVDCSQLEQNEHPKKSSESTSLTEDLTAITTENILAKEEAQVEDHHIESLQVATEDIQASAPCQETSSIEKQILTADSKETSCDKTEEKTTDLAYTEKESFDQAHDVGSNVPNGNDEANSPNEVDGSQKPSLEEASTGNTNENESTIIHDVKFANEDIAKAGLFENEKNIECASVKEEVSVVPLQVENEDIKATVSSQDRETSHLEEQGLLTDPQGIMGDHKEDKTIDVTDLKEETHEDKSYATISHEDTTKENSLIQEDCSQLEQSEHSENESESTSLTEAPTADATESTLVKEEAQVEDHIESCQLATEDIKAFAPCQDTETSSTGKQILAVNPEDIPRDKTIEKTIDATDKAETLEVQDIAKNVPRGENEDNSPNEEDGSQKPSLKEASTEDTKDHESTIMQEAEFVDESLIKADLFEKEQNTEGTLVKEYVSIESSQVAAEDIKASSSSEARETNSQEEQIQNASPGGLMGDDKENETIDSTDLQKETPKDEVPKEIENVNIQATNVELKEEEVHLKDLQMTTAVNIADREANSSNSTAAKIPRTEDLDDNKDVVGHLAEDPDCKPEESSITKLSEEQMITSNENVPDVTGLASEVSERNNDHKVVEEANSCGDKTDTEKIGLLDDGSITIPTNETLAETDPRRSTETEVQVPDGEKEAESVQQDLETETDQKDIEEQLPVNASQVVSESKGVNGEEERTFSENCKEISGSSNSVALEEVSSSNGALEDDSTSNSFQEYTRETTEEAEIEEAPKQEEKLHVSAPVQDSPMAEIEKDVQLCVASVDDSDVRQEMPKLQESPLPAPDENIIETKECKESEVVEDAIKNEEEDDRTRSFLDDKKATEREQEEAESELEKVTLDENVETTKSTSVLVANDFIPISPSETSKVDHSITEREVTTDREELHTGKTASDGNDETTLTATEGKDVESTSVGETSALISKCERDGYEQAYTGSVTEVKSDSNEVSFEPGEQKSGCESKNQVLESVAQVQTCDVISEIEETKIEEKNLEAAGEIKSDKVVAEDTFGQEETKHEKEIMKDNISSEKSKEKDEDVEDYHQRSCEEEVIKESHPEEEVKQEEEINTEKISEVMKIENETEKVSKISEEADEKALKEPEEKAKSFEEATTILNTEEAHGLDIAYVKTGTQNSNKEQQEEDSKSKHEILPLPELAQGKESEKQNQIDEICSSDEVQEKDEEDLKLSAGKSEEENKADSWSKPNEDEDRETYVEAEKLDFTSHANDISEVSITDGAQGIPEDHETSTTENKSSEEEYPNKSKESQISTVSDDIELTEQASEATRITAELQEPKAGIDSRDAIPNVTGVESQQVEEEKDKCKVMAETSTPVEPPTISTSKTILECTVGTSQEVEDPGTKLQNLHQELIISDTEVDLAEKDDPKNLQNVRDISEDVQGSNEGSFEVSKKEIPVEAVSDENLQTSEGQETEGIQNAPVSETLKQETEEPQLGGTSEDVSKAGVNCEEEKTTNDKFSQLEISSSAGTEKVSESNIHQSSIDDTAQHDKNEGSQTQIDPLSILPQAKCSDIETAEKDLPMHFAGLDGTDVTELVVTPLPSKDKHVVLEADQTKNLNPEKPNGSEHISAECSQGEHGIPKPSKVEQQEADSGNEERKEPETREKPESKETNKPSVSDLSEVSMGENLKMADHSSTDKEPTIHRENLHAEKTDGAENEGAKTDEEKDDEEESSEQKRSDLSSEAPVMVDMGDADVKVSHKKSHNILSGVGSKVKHSIAKVKKAITGKSSHPKTPSPKKVIT